MEIWISNSSVSIVGSGIWNLFEQIAASRKHAGNCETELYVLQTITESMEFKMNKRNSKLGCDNINSFEFFLGKNNSIEYENEKKTICDC